MEDRAYCLKYDFCPTLLCLRDCRTLFLILFLSLGSEISAQFLLITGTHYKYVGWTMTLLTVRKRNKKSKPNF